MSNVLWKLFDIITGQHRTTAKRIELKPTKPKCKKKKINA